MKFAQPFRANCPANQGFPECASDMSLVGVQALSPPDYYAFTLYVSGASETFRHAQKRLRELCFAHLPGRHYIRVVNLPEEADDAVRLGLSGTPDLMVDLPAPIQRFIGDLAKAEGLQVAIERAQ